MQVHAVCRRCYPLVAPTLILFAAALLVQQWPVLMRDAAHDKELQALATILPHLPHAVFLSVTLMGWCVHNAGMLLTAWFSGLVYGVIISGPFTPVETIPDNLALPLLVCLAFFSLFNRRRYSRRLRISWMLIIIGLVVSISLWARGHAWTTEFSNTVTQILQAGKLYGEKCLPVDFLWNIPLSLAICTGTVTMMMFRFFRKKDILLAGYAGMMVALWLGVHPGLSRPAPGVYFLAAGLILIVSAIWSAFTLAYHDELTGLAGRRSLNEALSSLGKTYAIAMIDVDHFKKFNDTYGHKTGDQVLKMIAGHLKQISGGARTFRYGGEEFTALFPGKTPEEALPELEKFRIKLAESPFIVRGRTRKKGSATQRAKQKAQMTRAVRVTVSIGLAGPTQKAKKPAAVIKGADQALYRAKKAGRNCIKS